MNRRCAFRHVLPALLILNIAGVAPAEDWPTYRHDNRLSGIATEKIDAAALKETWTWRSTSLPVPAWHAQWVEPLCRNTDTPAQVSRNR